MHLDGATVSVQVQLAAGQIPESSDGDVLEVTIDRLISDEDGVQDDG